MDAERLLTATRSARRSLDLDAPIDWADIRDCLRIALQAPNGTNQQSWRWLVIADRDRRAEIARRYRDAYLLRTGGQMVGDLFAADTAAGKLMSSTEWLVEHIAEVPLLVIPCFEPYLPRIDGDDAFHHATVYGSIFPAVWNFQLALHTRGYGSCVTTLHLHYADEVADLLGIPPSFTQGCLLPVARLHAGHVFRPATRRPLEDVAAVDCWEGKSL
jgi:nitroreductase